MRGGDEVVVEGLAHILVHLLVVWIENHGIWIIQEHEEAVFGQQLLPLG